MIGYKSVTKVTVCGGLSIVEAEEKHVVKGIVVDKCGNPLIGAVVTERGMIIVRPLIVRGIFYFGSEREGQYWK